MTMDRSWTGSLATGCPIYTRDGDKIGEVGEVAGDMFKVDASMQPDYWLRTDCVLSASTDRVTVSFDKDHLGDYKLNGPKSR